MDQIDAIFENCSSIEEILEDLRCGAMVIVVDDESRENEGDLQMVAEKVTSEDINFMAQYARGLICLSLTQSRCESLKLPLMVPDTDNDFSPNFTVSIEAAEGVTTGISADDRARTIKVTTAADAKPEHLKKPGHIFPLMSKPGGVLTRAGHTEAGCDLTRLAGFTSAAVTVEILNKDGAVANRSELVTFANKYQIKMTTIADLIRYRLAHDSQ
jgi:3,4-dihydroxy 2-butanone 4-phosphate synthase/GTP cyclohydrolase II